MRSVDEPPREYEDAEVVELGEYADNGGRGWRYDEFRGLKEGIVLVWLPETGVAAADERKDVDDISPWAKTPLREAVLSVRFVPPIHGRDDS